MPRLPDVNSLGARPTPSPTRGVASYRSGQVESAIGELGGVVSQIGEKMQQEDDAQAVFEARRKLDAWERDAIFDPEKGAASKRGRDALGLPKSIPQDFDKFASEVGATLTTKRQKQAFQELAFARRGHLTGWADKYASQQREVFESGQYEADINAAADRAALYATDPSVVATESKVLLARTVGYLRSKGASEEEIQQAVLNNGTKLHAQVAQTLLRTDPAAAKQYIDANKKAIDPVQYNRLAEIADSAALDTEAKRLADGMATLPLAEQLKKTSELTDPKLREKARLFVRQNAADIASARAAAEKEISDQVWQMVSQGSSYAALPRDVLAKMDGKERIQVQDHYRAEAKRRLAEAEGKPVKTDMATLENLYAMQPEEFLKVRISALQDKLSRADQEELIKRQANLRDPAKAPQAATAEQQIAQYVDELKLGPGDKGPFRRAVTEQFSAFIAQNKREPNYDERTKILDRLTQKVDIPWGMDKRDYKLTPEEREQARRRSLGEVPKQRIANSDRDLIKAALKAEGMPITEDAIQFRYFEARGGR